MSVIVIDVLTVVCKWLDIRLVILWMKERGSCFRGVSSLPQTAVVILRAVEWPVASMLCCVNTAEQARVFV